MLKYWDQGHRVQNIKVVGNLFLNTDPKEFFEYLAYLSSFTFKFYPRLQL